MAKKGSVLVVDDEEIMRDVLETLLSAEGYRVDLAKTGEEGLEVYGRRSYDVVLLDVSMPGMNGLDVLGELLKTDADAVVVMITPTQLTTLRLPRGSAGRSAASASRFATSRSRRRLPRESSGGAKRKSGGVCGAR